VRNDELMGGVVLSRSARHGASLAWFDRAKQRYYLLVRAGIGVGELYDYGTYQALTDAVWEKLDDSDLSEWQAEVVK